MRRHQRCLQVFAREPHEGRVKTRLIPVIGAVAATAVYRRLLARTLQAAKQADADRVEIWLDREPESPTFAIALTERGFSLHVQPPLDLGRRMSSAIGDGLGRADRVVLIGSDCPSLTPGYLDRAFTALERHDVVIGPTHDGGYILVGMCHAEPTLFDGIRWSTPQVLAQTRDRLRRLALDWAELPTQRDIDQATDLDLFPELLDGLVRGSD
ncbi:MAG: TIGR04282 family arsenosugar biosynthesis glycosyltransferase [Gammaproteobacteria bacterium]|nr:TIGR04282 family arsenosugar biosynthesis glycosyltransferase [Gammaproteobacteria bacterium]